MDLQGGRAHERAGAEPAEKLRIGLPVRVAFETVKDGLTLLYLPPGEPE
jgi:uncharacterized protein